MSSASAEPHAPPPLKTRLAMVVLRLTPDCREVSRLTSEERDHPLPLGLRSRLHLHRMFCKYCARYAKQLDLLRDASQRLPEQVEQLGGPGLKDSAKERLKRALREGGAAAGEAGGSVAQD
jgi:hypothetical protein